MREKVCGIPTDFECSVSYEFLSFGGGRDRANEHRRPCDVGPARSE